MAVLAVRDQGPGFPVQFLPRAFERFSRPDESRNRDGGGTGLGLAVVESLAQAHGGAATVANGQPGGAVVRSSFLFLTASNHSMPLGPPRGIPIIRPGNHE